MTLEEIRKRFAETGCLIPVSGATSVITSHEFSKCDCQWDEILHLAEWALAHAQPALEYVEHRTNMDPEKGMHPHGFIRSSRMRGTVVDALAAFPKESL